MTPLATYLATETHKTQVRRKLTEAEAQAMIAEYQGGAPIQPLINKWGMSQERFYRILAAADVAHRPVSVSLQMWHDAQPKADGGGTDRQIDEGFVYTTPQTVKPPRHRKAAPTPRRKWVEVADFCDKCGGTFDLCAPAHVAGRLREVWRVRHVCS